MKKIDIEGLKLKVKKLLHDETFQVITFFAIILGITIGIYILYTFKAAILTLCFIVVLCLAIGIFVVVTMVATTCGKG